MNSKYRPGVDRFYARYRDYPKYEDPVLSYWNQCLSLGDNAESPSELEEAVKDDL